MTSSINKDILIFIILLTLGAVTKYGGNYEAGIEYKQKYTVEKQFDFETFNAADYVWGGYQYMTEINHEEAVGKLLKCQANWITSYLNQLT